MYGVKDDKYTEIIRLLLAKPIETVIGIVFHAICLSNVVLTHKVCLDQIVERKSMIVAQGQWRGVDSLDGHPGAVVISFGCRFWRE